MLDPLLPHILLSALAAAAAGVFFLRPTMHWNLNYAAFMKVLLQLVQVGNLPRAHKLCGAVPQALTARVAGRVLGRALDGDAGLAELAAATHAGLADAVTQLDRWRLVGGLALALVATSVAAGVLLDAPLSTPGWALTLLAALLLAAGARSWARVHGDLQVLPVDLLVPLVGQLTRSPPTAEEVVAAVEAQAR